MRIDASGTEVLAAHDTPHLCDPALDNWLAEEPFITACVTQGDYHDANILCSIDKVIAVIDWHDANIVPCISELAWAAWQCTGHNCEEEFVDFVRAYLAAGGPVTPAEAEFAFAWLRVRLRDSMRRAIALGCPPDHPYFHGLLSPFRQLKGRKLAMDACGDLPNGGSVG